MKKIIPLLLVILLLLSGCTDSGKVSVENSEWKFSRIIEADTNKVVFSNEKDNSKFEGSKIIDLSCSATENQITIKDNASGTEWILDYTENKNAETNNPDGSIYEVTYTAEEKSIRGYATTGIANLNDVVENEYLIITLGGYELHFVNLEDVTLN